MNIKSPSIRKQCIVSLLVLMLVCSSFCQVVDDHGHDEVQSQHDDSNHHTYSAQELGYKLGTAAGLFLFTLAFSYCPYLIKQFKNKKVLVGLANAMAGGIFLGAGLLHIIPEATEMFNSGKESSHSDFPWIPFTVMMSFAMILFLDRIVLPGHHGHGHNHHHVEEKPSEKDEQKDEIGIELEHENEHEHHCHHNHDCQNDEQLLSKPVDEKQLELASEHPERKPYLAKPFEVRISQVEPIQHGNRTGSPDTRLSQADNNTPSTPEPQNDANTKKEDNVLGPYAILFAMGLHAVFEGLALGLMGNMASFLGFLLAIVFHKWAESMAVGINFLKHKVTKWKRLIAFCIFALLTPTGVVIGLLLEKTNEQAKGIVLAVSGGTFIYIAIAEIISEEFGYKKGIVYRFLAFLIGVGVMLLTWYAEVKAADGSDEHDH